MMGVAGLNEGGCRGLPLKALWAWGTFKYKLKLKPSEIIQ